MDVYASGQSLVAALAILGENLFIAAGVDMMQLAVEQRMERARKRNKSVMETLVYTANMSWFVPMVDINFDENFDELEKFLGKDTANVFVSVQPLLGVEGDPMRLLFERDLIPHPQYCTAYEWKRLIKD